jgi:hypothetical protein
VNICEKSIKGKRDNVFIAKKERDNVYWKKELMKRNWRCQPNIKDQVLQEL